MRRVRSCVFIPNYSQSGDSVLAANACATNMIDRSDMYMYFRTSQRIFPAVSYRSRWPAKDQQHLLSFMRGSISRLVPAQFRPMDFKEKRIMWPRNRVSFRSANSWNELRADSATSSLYKKGECEMKPSQSAGKNLLSDQRLRHFEWLVDQS